MIGFFSRLLKPAKVTVLSAQPGRADTNPKCPSLQGTPDSRLDHCTEILSESLKQSLKNCSELPWEPGQIMHISCLTQPWSSCPAGGCCGCSLCSCCNGRTWIFHSRGKQLRERTSEHTLWIGNCIKNQGEMLPDVPACPLSPRTETQENPTSVDAAPTADGNKRRLKLVAF